MAWQLIYTSAEHGLGAGRSGFCIVARHGDIRERLVVELERLSVFDRPSAGQPLPVIRTHRILTVGSDSYHILSCIQDAGPDYSGRTNHIAHHLICEEHELTAAASPALVLRRFPWHERWDEPARFFDDSERVDLSCFRDPTPTGSPWKELTGSAAHARLLIEPKARAGCYVAYPRGDDDRLLMLFHESLGRLADKSGPLGFWQVSFTTMWQVTDNPSDFAWRGCWAGSAAQHEAVTATATVFDLTHPGSLPTPAPLELKIATNRATPIQPAIEVGVQRVDTGQRKSTWKKVRGSYEGLSNEERQQQLMAQIPAELLARQKRKKKRHLFLRVVGVVMIVLLLGFLCMRWGLRHVAGTSPGIPTPASPTETEPPPIASQPTSAPPPSPTKPTGPAPQPTLSLRELDQLPTVQIHFVVGRLQSGVDVSGIINGKPPTNCHAIFVKSRFTNFPANVNEAMEEFTINTDDANQSSSIYSKDHNDDTRLTIKWRKIKTADEKGNIQTTETSTLSLVNHEYQDVALWFGQSEIILLDSDALGTAVSPFPPLRFGTNWLNRAGDNKKVELHPKLVERLTAAGLDSMPLRLTIDNMSDGSRSLDPGAILNQLQANIESLKTDLDTDKTKLATDRAKHLGELLTSNLGMGGLLLKKAGVTNLNTSERRRLESFKAEEDRNSTVLWDKYYDYLSEVVEHISKSIPQQNGQLHLPESAKNQPADLAGFASMLENNFAKSSNPGDKERFEGFKSYWVSTFNQGILNRVQYFLNPAGDSPQEIRQKEEELRQKKSQLESFPENVTKLHGIQLDIQLGKRWWPMIEFKNKP
jgi:hypothetical protein